MTDVVQTYVEARRTHDERTLLKVESEVTGLMTIVDTSETILREVLTVCLEDSCVQGMMRDLTEAEYLIVLGLRNPNCPSDILAQACHHKNILYRRVAARNHNCPDVDAVEVALTENLPLPVMVIMRHTQTSFKTGNPNEVNHA